METKNQNHSFLECIRTIGIVIIAVCSIILVYQGKGTQDTQDVYVRGGSIDANVSGSVRVNNKVDVNLQTVLGRNVGCRKSYTIDGEEYEALDVSIR